MVVAALSHFLTACLISKYDHVVHQGIVIVILPLQIILALSAVSIPFPRAANREPHVRPAALGLPEQNFLHRLDLILKPTCRNLLSALILPSYLGVMTAYI